jgi:hypothetical protein
MKKFLSLFLLASIMIGVSIVFAQPSDTLPPSVKNQLDAIIQKIPAEKRQEQIKNVLGKIKSMLTKNFNAKYKRALTMIQAYLASHPALAKPVV